MLKQLLLERNISTYKLAKDIGEPYSTINDLVNKKVDIEDCKVKILRKISEYLGQSMEETMKQCSTSIDVASKEYDVFGKISVRHKKYYVDFIYDDKKFEKEICKVTESSSSFIIEAAIYEMDKMITNARLEKYLCFMK